MRAMRRWLLVIVACGVGCGGGSAQVREEERTVPGTFGDDVAFLRAHLPGLVVLERGDARIAVAPEYQGRVMTSSARGDAGRSYGWMNRELIASGRLVPHMNAFGGEDRFWLGPEGGPFALYFPPGAPFELEQWQVPAAIDSEPWAVASRGDHEVVLRYRLALTNRAGTRLAIDVERSVFLFDADEPRGELELSREVRAVAYRTRNTITNAGDAAWRPESGLVSIWILSMYRPSPRTTVVVPFVTGPEEELGPIVNDAYFGEVPPDRLRVDAEAGALFFRADGLRRSKIGVAARRARPFLGSWDADNGVLTIVSYSRPDEAPHGYVNSMWNDESPPFEGDVVNSYNDGPTAPGGAPLGPFYELETSSPAAALAPGESLEHVHRTVHLEGPRAELDRVARALLGVGLDDIEDAL